MLIAFLILLLLLLAGGLGIAVFYMLRFANIVLVLETDLSEAIEVHERSVETFDKILGMQLFFDSPDVRPILIEAQNDIKMCKFVTQKIIQKFIQRSKQKYVETVEVPAEEEDR